MRPILIHPDTTVKSGTRVRPTVLHIEAIARLYSKAYMYMRPLLTYCILSRIHNGYLTLYIWMIRSPGSLASSSFTEYLISTSNSRELSSLFLHEKVPVTMVPS